MVAKLTIRLDVQVDKAEYFQFAEKEFADESLAQEEYNKAVEAVGGLKSEVDYIGGGLKN